MKEENNSKKSPLVARIEHVFSERSREMGKYAGMSFDDLDVLAPIAKASVEFATETMNAVYTLARKVDELEGKLEEMQKAAKVSKK